MLSPISGYSVEVYLSHLHRARFRMYTLKRNPLQHPTPESFHPNHKAGLFFKIKIKQGRRQVVRSDTFTPTLQMRKCDTESQRSQSR